MVLQNWSVRIGGVALLVLIVLATAAPWLGTVDPTLVDAASRDLKPGAAGEIMTLEGEVLKHTFLMGSDSFGRDIYSRVLYGTRVSLLVGIASALVALAFGVVCGLGAGYLRWLDGPLMRVMDGVMAIPAILIAIALVAMWRGSLLTVVVAIAVPEIPRVTRLVRSLVLSIREEPYVEAAISLGTAGLVGMGIGVGFGLSARSQSEALQRDCDGNVCSSQRGMIRIGRIARSRGLTRSSRPHVNSVGH